MIAFGTAQCSCQRQIEVALRAPAAPLSADAIGTGYALAAFLARLVAVARGWAVGEQAVVCSLCLERSDAGTLHRDPSL